MIFYVLPVSLLLFAVVYLLRQFAHGLGDLPDEWTSTNPRHRSDR